jgi:hypothetical protein
MGNTIRRFVTAVWGWCKVRWRWITVGVALLLSFLYGFFRRPKVGPTTQENQDETRSKEDQLQQDADAKAKALSDKAARECATQIVVLKDETEEVGDDLQDTNAYVIDAGKEVRKP